jgi:cation diffusion facilitator family transporter
LHEGSQRAIIAAFLANLGIAVAKFVGFAFTGAASMLAEAVHSVADTSNQGLLLLGGRRARRPPTPEHPFGYGKERYFWSFVVALVLFTAGALFALFEGEEKLRHPHELESTAWAVGILVVAMALEGFSFRTAYLESRDIKRADESWWRFIRRAKTPELPVVLLEDSGALLGLAFALAGIAIAELTGNPRWDAVGSVAIGLLLAFIAITLATEMKSLLIGEAALPEQEAAIKAALEATDGLCRVIHLRTEHLAPDRLLVGVKFEPDPGLDMPGLASLIDQAEAAVRAVVPEAQFIYLEPDLFRVSDEGAGPTT